MLDNYYSIHTQRPGAGFWVNRAHETASVGLEPHLRYCTAIADAPASWLLVWPDTAWMARSAFHSSSTQLTPPSTSASVIALPAVSLAAVSSPLHSNLLADGAVPCPGKSSESALIQMC
jgi:hypothetical protein